MGGIWKGERQAMAEPKVIQRDPVTGMATVIECSLGLDELVHHTVRPITRELFPLGVPVIVEAMIDRESGWEFDAPLHFISPFHRYREVGSISIEKGSL